MEFHRVSVFVVNYAYSILIQTILNDKNNFNPSIVEIEILLFLGSAFQVPICCNFLAFLKKFRDTYLKKKTISVGGSTL